MECLSKIVKNNDVKVAEIDNELDYLKKEEYHHKEVKK